MQIHTDGGAVYKRKGQTWHLTGIFNAAWCIYYQTEIFWGLFFFMKTDSLDTALFCLPKKRGKKCMHLHEDILIRQRPGYLFIFLNSISCVGIGKCEVICLLCWLLEKCGKTKLQTEFSAGKLTSVKGSKTSFCWVVSKFCIAVPSGGKKS